MSGAKTAPVSVGAGALAAGTILPLVLAGGLVGYGAVKLIQVLREKNRARQADRNVSERINAVRRQAEQEMKNRIAPLESRQRQYENMVSGLQSELGNLERNTQQRIKQQQNEFVGRLQEQRGEYLRLFQDQEQKFASMIEDERRQRQQAADSLQSQITSIVEDARRKQDIARSFLNDLLKIVDQTDELPHQRFAPGALDAIRRHVEDARQNVESNNSEAGLSTAQQAYWKVVDLRDSVLQKEREFMLVYQAALEQSRSLLEEAHASRKYELDLGEEGASDLVEVDVDFWTREQLSEFEKELEGLVKQLTREENTLSVEAVKEILEKIEAMKTKPEELSGIAVQNIVASQLRVNIAEVALEGLKKQGFELEDSAYEGDDERSSYVVKARKIAGSEVVTVIAPGAGVGENTLMINSYDETFVDEATLQQRANEIVAVINQEGLQAGTPEHVGNAKPEYRDMRVVRERKAAT